MPKQDLYATLSVPGTKKVSVCYKRVGSRDRMMVIATCNDEFNAEKIVDALNALQGKIDKLSLPAIKELEFVREELAKQRALHSKYHSELQHEKGVVRDRDYKIRDLEMKLRAAEMQRDAAQKAALEKA